MHETKFDGETLIDGVLAVRTCLACPEQYDLRLGAEMIGYVRLRHGRLSLDCPGVSGTEQTVVEFGDDRGIFGNEEREGWMRRLTAMAKRWAHAPIESIAAHHAGLTARCMADPHCERIEIALGLQRIASMNASDGIAQLHYLDREGGPHLTLEGSNMLNEHASFGAPHERARWARRACEAVAAEIKRGRRHARTCAPKPIGGADRDEDFAGLDILMRNNGEPNDVPVEIDLVHDGRYVGYAVGDPQCALTVRAAGQGGPTVLSTYEECETGEGTPATMATRAARALGFAP